MFCTLATHCPSSLVRHSCRPYSCSTTLIFIVKKTNSILVTLRRHFSSAFCVTWPPHPMFQYQNNLDRILVVSHLEDWRNSLYLQLITNRHFFWVHATRVFCVHRRTCFSIVCTETRLDSVFSASLSLKRIQYSRYVTCAIVDVILFSIVFGTFNWKVGCFSHRCHPCRCQHSLWWTVVIS